MLFWEITIEYDDGLEIQALVKCGDLLALVNSADRGNT
jgi:hypothetical protein